MAGIELMEIGWVGRVNSTQGKKRQDRHAYHGIDSYKVKQLSAELKFNFVQNMDFLKQFFDQMHRLDDGRYVITKPAYQKQFRIYQVPNDDEGD